MPPDKTAFKLVYIIFLLSLLVFVEIDTQTLAFPPPKQNNANNAVKKVQQCHVSKNATLKV